MWRNYRVQLYALFKYAQIVHEIKIAKHLYHNNTCSYAHEFAPMSIYIKVITLIKFMQYISLTKTLHYSDLCLNVLLT